MAERVAITASRDRLAGAQEVADYLGVPLGTVYAWNTRGTGPRRFRIGRHVRYRLSDVEAWLEQQAENGGRAA